MLVLLLERYFGRGLNVKDFGQASGHLNAGEFIYCEYHNYCRQNPCMNFATKFQKNNDFELRLKKDSKRLYSEDIY